MYKFSFIEGQWKMSCLKFLYGSLGDRGVQVKKSMLGLFERSPWEGTDACYRMSKLILVQKLPHFEVCNFGGNSYKKIGKISILVLF